MSNANTITTSWFWNVFSTFGVSVNAASTAERQGVALKCNGLKNLYFKTIWVSRLATIYSKTLPSIIVMQ